MGRPRSPTCFRFRYSKIAGTDRGNYHHRAQNGAGQNGNGRPEIDDALDQGTALCGQGFCALSSSPQSLYFRFRAVRPEDDPEFKLAEEFARQIAAHNYMVITGGGDGIMGAAQSGAGREHSFGLNIRLPFEQRANATILGDSKLINFNYFFTRKLNFVKETHALRTFPGWFWNVDEGFETLTLMQTGKARMIPVVLLDMPDGTYWETWMKFLTDHLLKLGFVSSDDFSLFKSSHSADEAVKDIAQFYKNYNSSRWVGDQLVIRITRRSRDARSQN